MEIRSESRIRHPREVVYRAYRDRLPEIVKYLPDVREIIVHAREETDRLVTLHNEWISERDVPAAARRVIKPEYLRWDDYALWHEEGWYCDWRIKTKALTDAVDCSGRNAFVADGVHTRVVLSGHLNMNLREIPGVPKILASSLAPQVERFIVSLITPNLEKVNQSLERFLDEERA